MSIWVNSGWRSALRQREERTRVHPAGHQIVAGAFGRGLGEDGRLDLQETYRVEIAPGGLGGLVAHHEALGHGGPPQVQVAVLQPQPLGGVHPVLDEEGGRLGGVEQLPVRDHDLDVAGDHVGVVHSLGPLADAAADGQHVLGAQNVGAGVGLCVLRRAEHDLGQALAVAQVDEDEPAVVAPELHPAHEADLGVDVFLAEGAAVVGTSPVAEGHNVLGVSLLHVLRDFHGSRSCGRS